jgi:hypothetical protein
MKNLGLWESSISINSAEPQCNAVSRVKQFGFEKFEALKSLLTSTPWEWEKFEKKGKSFSLSRQGVLWKENGQLETFNWCLFNDRTKKEKRSLLTRLKLSTQLVERASWMKSLRGNCLCRANQKKIPCGITNRYLCTYIGTYVQGCQMGCFQAKNPNLGKFKRILLWKILLYFMTIWSSL